MLGEKWKSVFRTGKNENKGMFKTVGNRKHIEIGRLLTEENLDIDSRVGATLQYERVCWGFAFEIKERRSKLPTLLLLALSWRKALSALLCSFSRFRIVND